jgi:hypothetical protein
MKALDEKGNLLESFLALPRSPCRYILVIHNSDETVSTHLVRRIAADQNVVAIFAQNLDPTYPSDSERVVIPLPIRLENIRYARQYPSLFAWCGGGDRKIWLLLSFSADNSDRKEAIDALSTKSFVHMSRTRDFRAYLDNLANSKFVISPVGNGLDCHRSWEALACGAIPRDEKRVRA